MAGPFFASHPHVLFMLQNMLSALAAFKPFLSVLPEEDQMVLAAVSSVIKGVLPGGPGVTHYDTGLTPPVPPATLVEASPVVSPAVPGSPMGA